MNRRFSSSLTFLFKYLFILIWSGGFGAGTIGLFTQNRPEKYGFLLVWILGTSFILAVSYNLKVVFFDGTNFVVSNYLKSIAIPKSNIASVSENRLLNIHPITLHLKRPSEFGERIVFMPVQRFCIPFGSHPIFKEIKELVGQ